MEITSRGFRWLLVPLGLLAGAALGAIARGWMRLITDDPEFSWNGTIFIVLAFTIAGLGLAIAWAARLSSARRRWATVARLVATVLTLPLFAGAGALMLPTVALASIATWRVDWQRALRAVLALLAAAPVVLVVADVVAEDLSWRRMAGLVLFLLTYAAIVANLRSVVAPLDDGWRMPRLARIGAIACGALFTGLVAVSAIGVAA
jgi:hypothetical protein